MTVWTYKARPSELILSRMTSQGVALHLGKGLAGCTACGLGFEGNEHCLRARVAVRGLLLLLTNTEPRAKLRPSLPTQYNYKEL